MKADLMSEEADDFWFCKYLSRSVPEPGHGRRRPVSRQEGSSPGRMRGGCVEPVSPLSPVPAAWAMSIFQHVNYLGEMNKTKYNFPLSYMVVVYLEKCTAY